MLLSSSMVWPKRVVRSLLCAWERLEEEAEGSGDGVRYHIRGEEGDLVIMNQGKGAAQGELENTEDIEIDVMGRRSVGLHLLEESASDT